MTSPAISRAAPEAVRVDRRTLAVDTAIALALSALSLIVVQAGARDIGSVEPVSVALLLLQTLPLAFRRLAPWPVLIVTAIATLAHAALATESLSTSLGSLVALYTVADASDRRRSSIAAVALAIGFAAILIVKAPMPAALGAFLQAMLTVFVTWLVGTWSRERRAYIGTVEDRAARAERDREIQAERAVADERGRIARELHDVVSHQVSVIVIQAGAARRALAKRPEDVAGAIEAIDTAGRHALTDMRRMLGILAGAPSDGAPDGSPPEPLPGLDQLGGLVERVNGAGVRVELSVRGTPRLLDPGIELGAYRIVQEALTNVLKHAPGGTAAVVVSYEPEAIALHVENARTSSGPSALAATGSGRGLIGMRERASILGGRIDAGPTPTGFAVDARLPTVASPSFAGAGSR